jgi:ferric-dicitrate binding protein FerR (iron transport regulator)
MNEPSNNNQNYASYVTPELRRGRLDAQWDQIADRLKERRGLRVPLFAQLSAGILVACALVGIWWWNEERSYGPSVWAGALVTSDDAPVNFSLAEGTLIELDPRSEVELLRSNPHAVKLSLKNGSARFDVAKRRTRRFTVHLGEVEVLVTGTQFRVHRSPGNGGEKIRVEVEEGSVEVRRSGGSPVRLTAGEQWTTFVRYNAQAAEPAAAEEAANEDDSASDWQPSTTESEESDLDAVEPSEEQANGAGRKSLRRRRRARLEEARAQDEAALVLFEQGNAARRLGRLREAAEIYAELVGQYPRDRRAALSAFELGRIRMDSLGDVKGAIEALERALKLDARRAFAEDALARLVLAQETLGNRRACEGARNRYLSRYPEGVHSQHVAGRCLGR